MREIILKKIEQSIFNGDEDILDQYGEFDVIQAMSDEKLLEVYDFMVGFRG